MEELEQRMLLSAAVDTINLGPGPDNVRLFWDSGNSQIAYQLNSATAVDIPFYVPGDYPNYYGTIQIVGGGDGDNFTVDERFGQLFSGTIIQSIEFDDGTGTNNLSIIGNAAGNALAFAPDDAFGSPTHSFVLDGTPITYNANIQPPQYQLGSGINIVSVQGDATHLEPLLWNNTTFDPGSNSNISLTIDTGGIVTFGDDATLESMDIQNDAFSDGQAGQARLQDTGQSAAITLTTNNLSIDATTGALLDLANNQLVVDYSIPNDPASDIRTWLIDGMNAGGASATATEQTYSVGNWDGPGVDSSAAAGNFPFALGYDDTGSAVIVKYTLYGDLDLDGQVTNGDTNTLVPNLNTANPAWSAGDLNYDGQVDSVDQSLLGIGSGWATDAPTDIQAIATYETRVDLTWVDNGYNITGYEINYWPDGDLSNRHLLDVSSELASTSLLPAGDTSFGQGLDINDPNVALGSGIRGAAVVDDNAVAYDPSTHQPIIDPGTGAPVNSSPITTTVDYTFEVGAIVNGVVYWSSPIPGISTAGAQADPAGQLAYDIGKGYVYIDSVTSAYEPEGLEIHSSNTDFHNLWIKRVDDTPDVEEDAVVILPTDHGDFFDVDNDKGETASSGIMAVPGYLDRLGGQGQSYPYVDPSHQYTYYASRQTGVPTVASEWQMIPGPDGLTASHTYSPNPSANDISAFQTLDDSGHPAVQLAWTADNDAQQNGYDLEWSTDNVTWHSITGLSGYDRDYLFTIDDVEAVDPQISSLTGTYYFAISALAGSASNPIEQYYSQTANITIDNNFNTNPAQFLTVPTETPVLNSVTPTSTDSVTLQWTNIDDSAWHGLPDDDRYVWIEVESDTGGFTLKGTPSVGSGTNYPTADSVIIGNLNPGTAYTFRIRAVADNTELGVTGESVPSNTIISGTEPDDVTNFQAVAYGPNLVQLAWKKPDPNREPDIEYIIERSGGGVTWPASLTDSANVVLPYVEPLYNNTDVSFDPAYMFDDTTVGEGTEYYYRICAVTMTNGNIGANSNFVSASYPLSNDPSYVETPPASPTAVTLQNNGDGSYTLHWQNQSTHATSLVIEYADSPSPFADSQNTDGSYGFITLTTIGDPATNSYPFTPAANQSGDVFTFRVIALVSDRMASIPSAVVSTDAPPAPTHISVTPVSQGAVRITWDYQSGSALTDTELQNQEGYRLLNETGTHISWVSMDSTSFGQIDVPANVTTYILDSQNLQAQGLPGLDPSKDYKFTLTPFNNNAGTGSISSTVIPMAGIDPDTLDSYRIGYAYEYLRIEADSQHYAGASSIAPGHTSWLQYDSAATALSAGARISQLSEADPEYTEHGNNHAQFITYNYIYTYAAPGPSAIADAMSSPYNYISFYEDTSYHVEYNVQVSYPQNDGGQRWSVEQHPTVSAQAMGVVTINGVQKAQFTLNRSGDTSQELRVTYAISANGWMVGNYDETSGVAVFLPGESAATIDITLHSGYDTSIGALDLSINWSDESNAQTVGSPYVAGANAVLVTTPAAGSSIYFSGSDIDYYNGRRGSSILETLDPANRFNIKILGNTGNDLLYGVGSPSKDTVNFDGGGGTNEIYYLYLLPTSHFDVYTNYVMQTSVGSGVTSIINFAQNTLIEFSQAGDGATGKITIHMVTDDDTLTHEGDGNYQWNWVAGQQSLDFAIEDTASGYWVTMLAPDGSSTQQFIGGKGDM